jgi:hypothetical protein
VKPMQAKSLRATIAAGVVVLGIAFFAMPVSAAPCGGKVDTGCSYGTGSTCELWAPGGNVSPVCYWSSGGQCNGATLETGCYTSPGHTCTVRSYGTGVCT